MHVEDRWTRPVKPPRLDKRGNPVMEETERYGHGLRYVATWTEHGKRRAKSFRTKDGALAHLADVAKSQRDGTHVEQTEVTVTEYAQRWMDAQLHQKRGTKLVMDSRWRNAIEPLLGKLRIRSVTKRHIETAAAVWARDHSPAYTKGIFIYCNAIFAAAVRDRVIPTNPCEGVKLPKLDRGKVIPMTTEQVWGVADRIGPRYQGLILLAAATGMRSAELRGLTADRILPGNPVRIRIDRQLSATTPAWETPKSDTSGRTVTIDTHAVDMLAWHMYRVPPHPSGLIFTTPSGKPVHASMISRELRDIAEVMHLPERFGLHAFRHYHASLLIAAGLSPTAVAARLGHASPALTLRVYSHLWMDDEDRARDAIERQLWA
jgi:integrase